MEQKDEICYRLMTSEDIPMTAALEAAVFDHPWTKQDFEASLSREDTLFVVAQKDDKIVGYVGCYQSFEEGSITNVAVDEKYRRRGIAHGILQKLFETGSVRGIERYYLEVRVSNVPAQALYSKLGFENVGRRKHFYQNPVEDAFLMMRQKD